jgi:hypothetical protein
MVDFNATVLVKCKTNKPERHKDRSGHHHPMGVFPIEQQVEHFGHCRSKVKSGVLARTFGAISPGVSPIWLMF